MAIQEEVEISEKRGSKGFLKLLTFLTLFVLLLATGISSYLLLDFAQEIYVKQGLQPSSTGADAKDAEPILGEAVPKKSMDTLYQISNNTTERSGEDLAALKSEVVRIETTAGHGSGVVINKEGYIITSTHGVQDRGSVTVYFQNLYKQGVEATVVKLDEVKGLALVKLDKLPQGVEVVTIPLEVSSKLILGDTVIAIEGPRGLMNTVVEGKVSALKSVDNVNYIETTAHLSSHGAGGALLNKRGALAGIYTILQSEESNVVISSEEIIDFLDDFSENSR